MSIQSDEPFALRARWILPLDRPPLAGGVLTIAGGRIAAIGENLSGAPARDLGDVALLPAPVNAHAHLEFSDLASPLGQAAMPLPDWIRLVIEDRRQRLGSGSPPASDAAADNVRAAFAAGLAELSAAGTAAVGQIHRLEHPLELLRDAPLAGVAFLELIGLTPDATINSMGRLAHLVDAADSLWGDWSLGISPHAPYTVSPQLLEAACRFSAQRKLPIAMHLAESRQELELLATGGGPFRRLLEERGLWHAEPFVEARRPLDYLKLLDKAHRAAIIHGNYLGDDEIEFLAARRERMSVVYCPRTHAFFEHERYPLARLLAAGVSVALGTDSRASNPDLNVWGDLRWAAAAHPDVAPLDLLMMATHGAARAIGHDDVSARLAVGQRADLIAVEVAPEGDSDLHAAVVYSGRIVAHYRAGS